MPRRANSLSRRASGVGLAPEVRHVRHDQQAQAVGPVELARHLDLDVNAVGVQPDPLRAQDLVAHEGIAGEGVEALRVIRLVERHLEVDRLVVQRDVGELRAGQLADADLAHAEVGADPILGAAGAAGRRPPRRGTDRPATTGAAGRWARRTGLPSPRRRRSWVTSGRPPVLKRNAELRALRRGVAEARPSPSPCRRRCPAGNAARSGAARAAPRDRRSARCPWPGRSPACLRA